MIVKAWNNGAHNRKGTGYGFKVLPADRDAHFKPEWSSIVLELEGEAQPAEVAIDSAGFWSDTCREVTRVQAVFLRPRLRRGAHRQQRGHQPHLVRMRFLCTQLSQIDFGICLLQFQETLQYPSISHFRMEDYAINWLFAMLESFSKRS
jgi:hypothetical protein